MRPDETSNVIKEYHIQNNLVTVLDDLFFSAHPNPEYGVNYPKLALELAGFKMLIHQLRALPSDEQFIDYIERNNVKVLINYRRDIAAQYVSERIAQKTGQVAAFENMVPVTDVIEINQEHMIARLNEIKEERQYLEDLLKNRQLDIKTIYYEDYKYNVENLEPVCKWLLGRKFELKSGHQKQNPEDIKESITNYNDYLEVRAMFL